MKRKWHWCINASDAVSLTSCITEYSACSWGNSILSQQFCQCINNVCHSSPTWCPSHVFEVQQNFQTLQQSRDKRPPVFVLPFLIQSWCTEGMPDQACGGTQFFICLYFIFPSFNNNYLNSFPLLKFFLIFLILLDGNSTKSK